jgi:hypothetical protein
VKRFRGRDAVLCVRLALQLRTRSGASLPLKLQSKGGVKGFVDPGPVLQIFALGVFWGSIFSSLGDKTEIKGPQAASAPVWAFSDSGQSHSGNWKLYVMVRPVRCTRFVF